MKQDERCWPHTLWLITLRWPRRLWVRSHQWRWNHTEKDWMVSSKRFYSAAIFNGIKQHVTVGTPIGWCHITYLDKAFFLPFIVIQVLLLDNWGQNLYSICIKICYFLLALYQCAIPSISGHSVGLCAWISEHSSPLLTKHMQIHEWDTDW